ncbi:MAG: restriction endonuclease [Gammaproteobacteria bacterium]|nr:restriction endonuclease [Gammaproteobacteria bacterium]MYF02216.1 restriction endonuclease [Gammaproteobacteria bacterium]MYI76955.1 restriction endonuclease [Gammaproteobacteria bacterium]
MDTADQNPKKLVDAIRHSGLSIYDSIDSSKLNVWIPTTMLQYILNDSLTGVSLPDLPLRTRSKRVKEYICDALGYPVPKSFKKTQPRFPNQNFDTYVQKSNNLQIWNEDIVIGRRYVIVRIDGSGTITGVRVVTGQDLARLDTTGTLTQKYQARLIPGIEEAELISPKDTTPIYRVNQGIQYLDSSLIATPLRNPIPTELLPIDVLFKSLKSLVGTSFPDVGDDQDRRRGESLHRLVCQTLGYTTFEDDGRFPDLKHQIMEVKLQTSPTIDLGLVKPDSEDQVGLLTVGDHHVRHCDVRYALFYAETDGNVVSIRKVYLTTGEKFFTRFPQFQGRVLNRKLQIRLSDSFFETE